MKTISIAVIFLSQIASTSAIASSALIQYRWRDHGTVEYGDVLPANAGAIGYDIMDGNGKLLRHVAPSANAADQEAQAGAARAQYERREAEQQGQAKLVVRALKQASDDQMHALQTLGHQQSNIGDRIIAAHKALDRMLSNGASPSSRAVVNQEAAIKALEGQQQRVRVQELRVSLHMATESPHVVAPALRPTPTASTFAHKPVLAPTRPRTNHAPSPGPAAIGTGALTRSECTRLVRRTFFNITSSKTSVPNSPFDTKMIASCMAGRSFFNRGYYNCIFSSKYSDTLDCAYAAKGVDRSKSDPILAARKPGEEGFYEGSAKEMEDVIYRGQDPRTTIDKITLSRYLDERDNVDRSLGEVPPADRNAPQRKSASHIDSKGKTYWIVRQDFTELQLAKIMRQEAGGSESVVCAQFGNSRRLRIDQGYCAAMVKKFFHVALPD